MLATLATLGLMLAIPATGWCVLRLAGFATASAPLAWALAVATGFAAALLALGLPFALTGHVYFAPAALALVAGAAFTSWRALASLRGSRRWLRDPFWAALAVLGLVLIFCARMAPFWGYDAKAIYGIKGKALLHERNLAGPLFQDVDVVHYHPDYPLGLPLLIAFSGWVAEGDPEDPTGAAPALTVAGWLQRHGSVRAYSSVACIWLLGVFGFVVHCARAASGGGLPVLGLTLLSVPWVILFPWVGGRSWSLEGADVPLALCVGATGFVVVAAERCGERGHLALAALLAAAAIFLKNDALLPLAGLVFALFACRGAAASWRPSLAILGGAILAGVAAASLAAGTAGAPYDEHYVAALRQHDAATLVARVPLLVQSTLDIFDEEEMGFYWAFVACAALPWALWRGGVPRLLGLWVLAHLGATLAVFLLTPNSVTWHVSTALPRLWAQVTLPTAALVIGAAAAAWSGFVGDARERGGSPRPNTV